MERSEQRILILDRKFSDSEIRRALAQKLERDVMVCESAPEFIRALTRNVEALVIHQDLVTPEIYNSLIKYFGHQPGWSQVSVFVLGDANNENAEQFKTFPHRVSFLNPDCDLQTMTVVLQLAVQNRKQQLENRELTQSVAQSRHEAASAQRVKNDFLANISHEIRTPLGAVMGFAELLMEPDLSIGDRQAYMKTIKRNGQLLAALIDDVLDLARVEAGKIEIEIHDVALANLIGEVFALLESRATQKNVKLIVQVDSKMPPTIQTDPFRLKQILLNIVGNAIKFTNQGRVAVQAYMKPGNDLKEKLVIEVRDDGIGITEQMQKNLFQPFSQGDSSSTRAFGGTGLGLMLSRQLARALGGDLTISHSAVGEGSTFCIEVNTGLPAFPKLKDSQSIAGMKVLLVEDSQDNQVLISRMLKLGGATVTIASDGIEGIRKALSSDINAILMDVQMPKLGGHEATRELRRRGFEKPIIAITAHAMEEDRSKCLEVGFDEYLTKPVDRALLFETLASAAGKTHSELVAAQFH